MIRHTVLSATITVVLSAVMMPSTQADEFADPFSDELQTPPLTVPAPLTYDEPGTRPIKAIAPAPQRAIYRPVSATVQAPMPINPDAYVGPAGPPAQAPGYVCLRSPMYPCPVPNVPIWAGSTMITSPALAPHEMLYPHTYRAIYPPYYHRVKGGWIWTPFGIRSHEKWELQGTEVTVKYRSQAPLWVRMSTPALPPHQKGNRY